MRKFVLVILIILLISSCKTADHNCDAYSDTNHIENNNEKNNI